MKKQVIDLKVMNQNFESNSDTELLSTLINKVAIISNLELTISVIIDMMTEDMGLSTAPEIHFKSGEDIIVIYDDDIHKALNHPRWFRAMSE